MLTDDSQAPYQLDTASTRVAERVVENARPVPTTTPAAWDCATIDQKLAICGLLAELNDRLVGSKTLLNINRLTYAQGEAKLVELRGLLAAA